MRCFNNADLNKFFFTKWGGCLKATPTHHAVIDVLAGGELGGRETRTRVDRIITPDGPFPHQAAGCLQHGVCQEEQRRGKTHSKVLWGHLQEMIEQSLLEALIGELFRKCVTEQAGRCISQSTLRMQLIAKFMVVLRESDKLPQATSCHKHEVLALKR